MKYTMQSIGKEPAIALYETGWWKSKTHREIAEFQMLTRELCCPFGTFHEAMEKTLDRPIWTHEFAFPEKLIDQLFNNAPAPSFNEIMDLIPAEKRIVVVTA